MKAKFFVSYLPNELDDVLITGLIANSGGLHSVDLIVGYNCRSFLRIILANDRKGWGSLDDKAEEGDSGQGMID